MAKIGEFREVPGPVGKLLLEYAKKSLVPTTVGSDVVIVGGDGVIIRDVDDNEYLCFDAGVGVANLGYGRSQSAVLRATRHCERLGAPMYIGTDRYNPYVIEAALLLQEITPVRNGRSRVYFDTKGTLATEAAMKAVRKWMMRHKKAQFPAEDTFFVFCTGAFHGRSSGALTVMDGRKKGRIEGYGLPYKRLEIPFPALGSGDIFMKKLDDVVRPLSKEGLKRIGAVILELVQGEGGVNEADKLSIDLLNRWCVYFEVPLIIDEIQTGFGRTGTFWCYEQYNLRPDIVLFGKAAGGGVEPITGMVIREDMSFQKTGEHSGTFGPDPKLCAALLATVDVIAEKELCARARRMGEYLKSKLWEAFGDEPWLKEIRGLGLLAGMEFCDLEDRNKPNPKLRDAIWHKAEELGLLTLPAGVDDVNPTLRFEPPLIVTKKDVDRAIEILLRAEELVIQK